MDSRLAQLNRGSFLQHIISLSTPKASLLSQLDILSFGSPEQSSSGDETMRHRKHLQTFQDEAQQERRPIKNCFYDVRIKQHFFRGRRHVVFVFSNVSTEKELERERVQKKYTRIMFASINHEARTPINVVLHGLRLIKPGIRKKDMKTFVICESSLQFLMMLVNDQLDFA